MINGTKDGADYASKIINGISCLYLTENEIMAEPQDIETSPKITRTLKVHKVLRTYNEDFLTSLLTKQTRFTFSGTTKRTNWKFVD